MRIKFELSDLEAFLAVAERNSFQAAAEHVAMSQPALTRRIQKLEGNLGVTLFDRTTRYVRLTLAGKLLQERARLIVSEAIETGLAIEDETALFQHQRARIVTVAVIPSVISEVLPRTIDVFRETMPDVRIRILDRLANDVAEEVATGNADFGFAALPANEPNLAFEPVIDDPIVVAMHREHRLASSKAVRWSDLSGTPLILPVKGTGNRSLIDEALARSRLRANWSYEVRRTTTALTLVEAGSGVAPIPQLAIARKDGATTVARRLIEPPIERTLGVIQRETAELSEATAALRDAIVAVVKQIGTASPD